MRASCVRLSMRLACTILCAFVASATYAREDEALDRSIDALADSLPQSARATLARIPDPKRRLLAARSYAKAGDQIEDKWSWTEAQTHAFESSAEYQRMQAAINELKREFEQQNPGYSLYANTEVRTLDLQIERWNSNRGVQMTADELFDAMSAQMKSRKVVSPDDLRTMLVKWHAPAAAPLAAPGLSAHGQLRALDFQVVRGSQLVAGTSIDSVARVWQREGWANRLHRAVTSISANFEGPLTSPNEPWHYRYTP